MYLSNGIPHSPTPRVGWGNSGDLTEYHVKNPSSGALPDVNTPIDLSPRIDRGFDNIIIRLYTMLIAHVDFTHPRREGGTSVKSPCIARGWGSGWGGVIDRCIMYKQVHTHARRIITLRKNLPPVLVAEIFSIQYYFIDWWKFTTLNISEMQW